MFSKFQLYASDQMSQTHHKIKGLRSLHFYSLLRQVKILFQTVADWLPVKHTGFYLAKRVCQ